MITYRIYHVFTNQVFFLPFTKIQTKLIFMLNEMRNKKGKKPTWFTTNYHEKRKKYYNEVALLALCFWCQVSYFFLYGCALFLSPYSWVITRRSLLSHYQEQKEAIGDHFSYFFNIEGWDLLSLCWKILGRICRNWMAKKPWV